MVPGRRWSISAARRAAATWPGAPAAIPGPTGGPVEPVFHTTATAALNSAAYIELAFVIPEHKQKLDHELVPLLNRLATALLPPQPKQRAVPFQQSCMRYRSSFCGGMVYQSRGQ